MTSNTPHTAENLGERIQATRQRLYRLYLGQDHDTLLPELDITTPEANRRTAAGSSGDVL